MSKKYRELAEAFITDRSEKNYTALYHKIRPALKSYIYNIVKDQDATDDILATTMTKLWTKIDQYNPDYQITTWIYRIAFNHALGWIRSRNRQYSLDNMKDFGIEVNNDNSTYINITDALNDFEYRTEMDFIQEESDLMNQYENALHGIQSLKPMYRGIIEDRLLNEMKYDEIAEKYDIPMQTVKNRIRRAKMLIAEFIEAQ